MMNLYVKVCPRSLSGYIFIGFVLKIYLDKLYFYNLYFYKLLTNLCIKVVRKFCESYIQNSDLVSRLGKSYA